MKKIFVLSLLVISLLIFSGCEQEVAEDSPEDQVPPAMPDVAPGDTSEPEIQQPAPVDASFISELRCIDGREGRIEAKITNTEDEEIVIGETVKFMINGLLTSKSECEQKTIAPGESTFCSDLSGPLAIRDGKSNLIIANTPSQKITETVICPASSEEEPEDDEDDEDSEAEEE
ncbi:hypothetical protein GF336_06830 [Candidatus Woesearchaeota archaeon]|nr:hypothetical protein [Candidatus Woesearchaeota archaeon]